MKFIQSSRDVFFVKDPIFSINHKDIDILRLKLNTSEKGRARINLHSGNEDSLHEMIIVISPASYIRPHKHPNKSEAFHIIYGAVDIVLFKECGEIFQVISLAANDLSKPFYYRMSEAKLHTLIVRSDVLVVHEITNGPFIKGQTVYAHFAPQEGDLVRIEEWENNLSRAVERFMNE